MKSVLFKNLDTNAAATRYILAKYVAVIVN